MKKLFLSFAAIIFASLAAVSAPLWMRYPAISPDGKSIAFTYKGIKGIHILLKTY